MVQNKWHVTKLGTISLKYVPRFITLHYTTLNYKFYKCVTVKRKKVHGLYSVIVYLSLIPNNLP